MATVLITGGRGFLGHMLAQEILGRGKLTYPAQGEASPASVEKAVGTVVVLDMSPPEDRHRIQGLQHVVGDLKDSAFLGTLFGTHEFDSVFHLAAVLSGQAETEFDAGMQVNVDGTRNLIACCRDGGRCPTVVITSSVAVFGSPSVSGAQGGTFSEDTPALPRSSYGMEKAVCELMLLDACRRKWVRGRSVRLPTIVVRPGRPNSAASSFCSSIVREPLNGERAVCPVPRDLPLWIQSPVTGVRNMVHAHNVELGAASPIITLPGLTTTPGEMVEAMASCGGDASLVEWRQDEFLSGVVSSWPGQINTPTAVNLGFLVDRDILCIVKSYAELLTPHSARA